MKHRLTEEECTMGHVKMGRNDDGELALISRGQCRRCEDCGQWIRPKNFDAECPGDGPSLT